MFSKGFTLIEIVIAISIFAFISLAFFDVSDSTFNQIEYITKEDNELLQVKFAMSKFKEDIESIYSPAYFANVGDPINGSLFQYETKNGLPIPGFFGTRTGLDMTDIVFFVCNNRRFRQNSKISNFAWVRYYTEEIDGVKKLIRQTEIANIYDYEIDWDQVAKVVMIENIKDISFSFWDEEFLEFAPLSLNHDPDHLILSLKVDLSWPADGSNKESFIALSKWWHINEKQLENTATIYY